MKLVTTLVNFMLTLNDIGNDNLSNNNFVSDSNHFELEISGNNISDIDNNK